MVLQSKKKITTEREKNTKTLDMYILRKRSQKLKKNIPPYDCFL